MKGNVEDITIIGIVAIVTGIVIFVVYLFLDQFSGSFGIVGSVAQQPIDQGLDALALMANSFIFVVIAMAMVSVVSAFYTETHPIFFVFSIIMFGICMIPIVIMSEFFLQFASTGMLLPIAAEFSLFIQLVHDYPTIAVAIGVMIMIALFAKKRDLQQGGFA